MREQVIGGPLVFSKICVIPKKGRRRESLAVAEVMPLSYLDGRDDDITYILRVRYLYPDGLRVSMERLQKNWYSYFMSERHNFDDTSTSKSWKQEKVVVHDKDLPITNFIDVTQEVINAAHRYAYERGVLGKRFMERIFKPIDFDKVEYPVYLGIPANPN